MNPAVVVIPTFNEKDNVQPLVQAIKRACPQADVLFVDDNSPDGTGVLIDEMVKTDPRVHVLHRPSKQGLGRAYVAGFQWALAAGYQFLFEMDADFSHDPNDLPRLLAAAQTADVAIGSRYINGVRVIDWPMHRLLLSKGAALYTQVITGLPIMDPTGGFKCFRRAVLETIDLAAIRSNGYSFQIEMNHTAWQFGFRLAEVPIIFVERRAGESKMNKKIVSEARWMVWKLLLRAHGRRHARGVHPRSIVRAGGLA
jgi:dolichol-phosphate mannosyltransferase